MIEKLAAVVAERDLTGEVQAVAVARSLEVAAQLRSAGMLNYGKQKAIKKSLGDTMPKGMQAILIFAGMLLATVLFLYAFGVLS